MLLYFLADGGGTNGAFASAFIFPLPGQRERKTSNVTFRNLNKVLIITGISTEWEIIYGRWLAGWSVGRRGERSHQTQG